MTAFPQEWIDSLAPLLKEELAPFLDTYSREYTRGIRCRCIPYPKEATDEIPWADARYLPLDSTIGATVLHDAGAFYLQEPSAMIPAALLQVRPGDKVLDLCAAPGGKSTQLGAALQGRGLLVSNDPNADRALVLSGNIERMGIPNAVVTSEMPDRLAKAWPNAFDRILVDAPCSGEGMFRRHPETIAEWARSSVVSCAERQLKILCSAAQMLVPGGFLVYSTCTFNRTENDDVIAAFLSEHADFEPVPFHVEGIGDSDDGTMHIWPHRVRGEGHFAAKLKKKDSDLPKAKKSSRPAEKEKYDEARAFLADHMQLALNGPIRKFKETLIYMQDCALPLDGLRVLRMGLHLGRMAGKAFIPDHALAMLQKSVNTYPLTDQEAVAFMAGETISCPESVKGWLTPVYRGMQLGWAKASGGMLKNHYPKGLRRPLRPNT